MFVLLVSFNVDGQVRSDADAQRDATSKPLEVLGFIGVKPGWQVIDLFAGDGYYAELLAQAVGDEGKVYLHNNQAYVGFSRSLGERVKGGRLPNVEVYVREVEDINLASNSLDMAILVKAYHDLYFVQNGWTAAAAPVFSTIKRVLKPGGVLAIIDHNAPIGSGTALVQSLHRIDPDFARKDIESYGFQFVEESRVLEFPEDDMSLSVFDEEISGHTSRFVFKFVNN